MLKDTVNYRATDHSYVPKIGNKLLRWWLETRRFSYQIRRERESEIIIDILHYKLTPGLNEFLLKHLSDDWVNNKADLQVYKNIRLRTSAHNRLYDPKKHRNKSLKYKNIIEKLFYPKNISGNVYSYWDYSNKLCDK